MTTMSDPDVVEAKKELPDDFFFEGQLIEMADGKAKGNGAAGR